MNTFVNTTMDAFIDKLFVSKSNDTSLIRRFSGPQSFLKNSNSMFQHIPYECHQELLENSLFASDFNTNSAHSVYKFNWQSFFRTFNSTFTPLVPKFLPSTMMQEHIRLLSSPVNVVDINPNLNIISECLSKTPMATKDKNDSVGQSATDQLKISLSSSPVDKTSFNITVTKQSSKSYNSKNMNCNFSLQLANRKTKELQKRSKKRRRRQKKVNINQSVQPNSASSKNVKLSENDPCVKVDNRKKNCDFICDVTISHNSNSKVSSFIVTVDSGEEDSDWDTNNETNWLADDSEFALGGLYITSFSSTNLCANFFKDDQKNCDNELDIHLKKLKEVNHNWEEATKHLDGKVKSKTLVSFAAEAELVEVFPVEMYERKGEWEIYATERLRFKKRIQELEGILSPCLLPHHRQKVYQRLQKPVS